MHLLSENCQAKLLLDTLHQYDYQRLIFVGDTVQDDSYYSDNKQLNWYQLQLIEYLRDRMRKKPGIELIRIMGNHDSSSHDFLNKLLGIKSVPEYRWNMNGKRYCAIHGHQFDRFIFNNPILSRLISTGYLYLQKIDFRNRYLTRLLDRYHTRWFRLTPTIIAAAIDYARKQGIDIIICGHTHEHIRRIFLENNRKIEYWNCGDWTGRTCAFISLEKNGEMQLHDFIDTPINMKFRPLSSLLASQNIRMWSPSKIFRKLVANRFYIDRVHLN